MNENDTCERTSFSYRDVRASSLSSNARNQIDTDSKHFFPCCFFIIYDESVFH